MPELPEVETIKGDLKKVLIGATLEAVEIKDFNYLNKRGLKVNSLKELINQKILTVERKGKLLILVFSKEALIFHLGMTGAFFFSPHEDYSILKASPILKFTFNRGFLFFYDPRKFSRIWIIPKEQYELWLENQIGPDALEISVRDFITLLKGSRKRIKTLLMDQKKIAGLGNIYTDELLFRAGINPFRQVSSLSENELMELYYHMQTLLREAIALRGSSIRNYIDGFGSKGAFQERHQVYGKKGQPCPKCGNPLLYASINGRGTTFCNYCQR